MQIVLILFFAITFFLLTRNVFLLAFSLENYSIHKKRLKQLEFDSNIKEKNEINNLIDSITKPIITYLIPKLKIKNINDIERDLKFAKWDKYMSANQFIALKIITKVLAVLLGLFLFNSSKFMAVIWFVVLFFSVQFLLNNSRKNREEKLMMDFPDLIRIVQGYLSSGMSLISAMEESIKFVGDEWKPILRNFVVEAELSNTEKALRGIAEEVDIFEVREFIAIINLTLEQGGDAREGFESQANKVQEMLHDIVLLKIQKRRVISILIQIPILLCIMAILGLPTVYEMMNLGL